jgi:hypothetical protein
VKMRPILGPFWRPIFSSGRVPACSAPDWAQTLKIGVSVQDPVGQPDLPILTPFGGTGRLDACPEPDWAQTPKYGVPAGPAWGSGRGQNGHSWESLDGETLGISGIPLLASSGQGLTGGPFGTQYFSPGQVPACSAPDLAKTPKIGVFWGPGPGAGPSNGIEGLAPYPGWPKQWYRRIGPRIPILPLQ